MTQKYHLDIQTCKFLAEKSNQRLRSALRMWYFLKTHGYQDSLYSNELRNFLLQNKFSYKQIKKYAHLLVEAGWMGLDSHGKYFLRGREFIFKLNGKRSRTLGVELPPEVTESHEAWLAFLSAVQVSEVHRRLSKSSHQRIGVASTSCSGGNAEVNESPVSLDNMTQMLNVSRATASRIRSRATKTGLTTNRVVLVDVTAKYPTRRLLFERRAALVEHYAPYRQRYAEHFDSCKRSFVSDTLSDGQRQEVYVCMENPNALIWYNGKAWEQRPNMISTSIKFRSFSR